MSAHNPHLRVNPGGGLKPNEVVGRDRFVATMWRALERQSLLLTAERRMGKTSVLGKMHAEPAPGTVTIMRSLQAISSPEEFVRALIADTEANLPGVLKRSLGDRLVDAGVRKIGVSTLAVEFEPTHDQGWKDVAVETLGAMDRGADVRVVLLWDELPHMIATIRDHHGPLLAREMLDLLRFVRETYSRVRMVFSGSLGLHHVVEGLRSHGGMWAPTHDMLSIDLPPLYFDDAAYLARELLRNEKIECDDLALVADAVAGTVDSAPFYVHHTVHRLLNQQRSGACGVVTRPLVQETVDQALSDPLDPWQLHHYVDRIATYYGDDAELVRAVLDTVATASTPPTLEGIHQSVSGRLQPPPLIRLHDLLVLLQRDYYLGPGPGYSFRLELVRRAWMTKMLLT